MDVGDNLRSGLEHRIGDTFDNVVESTGVVRVASQPIGKLNDDTYFRALELFPFGY